MSLPATTRITSPYGESADYDGFHNGIDFAHIDPDDTPVFAFRAGVVTWTGWVNGWAGRGFVVIVDHGGGVVSWSCHLASSAVNVGDRVAAGQRIATMGNTGTKYVHLHWMIYLHGQVVDPTPYLTASAGGDLTPFDPEEDDMPIVLERGIDTGFMVTYPTPRGISRVVIDSIANARGVVEQATKSKIVQMYPADFDAFVRVFGPIYAPPAGSDADADRDYAELLAEIRALPTAAENAEEFAKRLAG